MKSELLSVAGNMAEVEKRFLSLVGSGEGAFFTSWGWSKAWLESLPSLKSVYLFCVTQGDNTLALGFIVRADETTGCLRWFRGQRWVFNATGLPKIDNPLWIEYNDLLLSSGVREEDGRWRLLDMLLKHLPSNWDEVVLPGLDRNGLVAETLRECPPSGVNLLLESDLPSYFVDLSEVRDEAVDVLGVFSRNTRSQLRRSEKAYLSSGAVVLDVASTLEEAMCFFQGLMALHRESFRQRQRKSEFATDFSSHFHERLIKQQFEAGGVQLLRVRSGDQVVGYLYNLVFNRKVYFFQGGLSVPVDNKQKPGMLCHLLALNYNLKQGMTSYDYLAGDERYKSSMSNKVNGVQWFVLQKPRLRFTLQRYWRHCKSTLKQGRMVFGALFARARNSKVLGLGWFEV